MLYSKINFKTEKILEPKTYAITKLQNIKNWKDFLKCTNTCVWLFTSKDMIKLSYRFETMNCCIPVARVIFRRFHSTLFVKRRHPPLYCLIFEKTYSILCGCYNPCQDTIQGKFFLTKNIWIIEIPNIQAFRKKVVR